MNARRPSRTVVGSPVLVGAVTVLVTTVAVFLAYNANNGLPFVPVHTLILRVPNADIVGRGAEIREGGFRTGVVTQVRLGRNGAEPVAELILKIDKSAGRLPVDSRYAVRFKGAIGGKYLEVRRGQSSDLLPDGAVVPASQTTLPVDFDRVFSTFNEPTRRGSQQALLGFGGALAGRGTALNETVAELPDLFGVLGPVMANLSAEATGLRDTIRASRRIAAALAPVAGAQGDAFAGAATTFAALARRPDSLSDSITGYRRLVGGSAADLATIRPVAQRAATLAGDARATAATLRTALPVLNDAVEVSIGPISRSVDFSRRLRSTLRATGRLVHDRYTGGALDAVEETARTLQTQLRFYGPQITVCNVVNQWTTFVPDVISSATAGGTAQAGLAMLSSQQDDSVGTMGANEVATGRGVAPGNSPQYLHAAAHNQAIYPDGQARCELGQHGYLNSLFTHDDTPDRFYRRAVAENQLPAGSGTGPTAGRFDSKGHPQGSGLLRVPKGMTFRDVPGGRAFPEGTSR